MFLCRINLYVYYYITIFGLLIGLLTLPIYEVIQLDFKAKYISCVLVFKYIYIYIDYLPARN